MFDDGNIHTWNQETQKTRKKYGQLSSFTL